MSSRTPLLALLLLALVATASMPVPLKADAETSLETLIANAEKLRDIAYGKLSALTAAVNATEYYANITEVQGILKEADSYLNASLQLYKSGNLTGAKEYVIYAMNAYDTALELIEELAEEAGVELELEVEAPANRTAELNVTTPGLNLTLAANRTALLLQLQVLKARLSQLNATLSKVNQSGYNLSYVFELISYAERTLSELEQKLASGNVTVSEIARHLAVVKKILGLVNAELNKASLHLTVVKAFKLGLLKKNYTEYLNLTLLNHTLPKFKEIRNRTRLGLNESAAELEEVEKETRNMTKLVGEAVKKLEKELKKEHAGNQEKVVSEITISAPKAEKPLKKPLPPGLEKKSEKAEVGEGKAHEERESGAKGQGKGKGK